MNTEKVKIELLTDDAISHIEDDKLGRGDFVASVAEIIHSQSTLVNTKGDKAIKNVQENLIIGLFGEWGFGKSSVLKLLQTEVEDRGLMTVYFNPWMYGSEEQLLVSLLNVIITKTQLKGSDKERLVELMKKYLPLIASINKKTGDVLSALTGVIGDKEYKTAEECKEAIDEILSNTANPLTILIDDVDRLSRSEVHILFKTIRLLASFKHVIYVVACDFDMVAKSIKENYVDGTIADGKAYLEKIIQIPLHIPEITSVNLRSFVNQLLSTSTEIDLHSNPLCLKIFEEYFYTPRDVKRFINSFRFTSTYLGKTIPIEQLLLIELIRLKVPDLFQVIKIYYNAIKVKDSDQYFKVRFHKYILRDRPELMKNNVVEKGNSDFVFWASAFKHLFQCTSLLPLGYQSSIHPNKPKMSFAEKKRENQSNPKQDFSDPQLLVSYFERISVNPEEQQSQD
jgi:predicted KAP-like P-loop ATPase